MKALKATKGNVVVMSSFFPESSTLKVAVFNDGKGFTIEALYELWKRLHLPSNSDLEASSSTGLLAC